MLVHPEDYNELLAARGAGAWGRLDYDGRYTNLRVRNIRQNDSNLRVYFDGTRDQIITGVRYAPIRANPFLMVPGYAYRVTSHIEFVKPVPDDLFIRVLPTQMMAVSGMYVMGAPLEAGFKGLVEFTCTVACAISIEDMTVVGYLAISTMDDVASLVEPKTKKSGKKAKAEKAPEPESEPEPEPEPDDEADIEDDDIELDDTEVDTGPDVEAEVEGEIVAAKEAEAKKTKTKTKPKTKTGPKAKL